MQPGGPTQEEMQALSQAVASGQISPEEAQQLIQQGVPQNGVPSK